MKKLYFLYLVFLSANVYSQANKPEIAFIKDFLKNSTLDYGEKRLVRNWPVKDSTAVKKVLVEKMEAFMKTRNQQVALTEEERKYIIDKFIQSYSEPWLEKDLDGITLLDFEDTKPYLKENHNNTILLVSHPIYLRDDHLLFISYTNLCCGQIEGNNGEGFFKKVKNKWEPVEWVSEGSY